MTLPLIIIIPLISGLFCSVIPNRKIAWLFTFLTSAGVLAISIYHFFLVYNYGSISYYLGGWKPPYGIEFKIDLLSSIFLVLISAITFITMPFAFFSVEQEIPKNKINSFYSCVLLCLVGLLGMLISHDVFNIYVFLELSSLTSYSLIAMGRNSRAPNAAFEYLIIGTIGATFYLFGIGLIYMMTGTLNISNLNSKLLLLQDNQVITLGIIFIFIGLGLKAALFPFHKWLVNTYSTAPSYISTLFSATTTKVAIYLMIRFTFSVFNNNIHITSVLQITSLFAIIAGSIFALRAKEIFSILPYSSISQIGYIIFGISLNSKLAITASILHLIFHSITKPIFFMLTQFENNKLIMVMLSVASFSLIGIPITAGFISKWYLIISAAQSSSFLSISIIAIGSVMTFFYLWNIGERIQFNKQQLNKIALLSPLILTILILIFGIYSKPLFDMLNLAITNIETLNKE